MDYMTKRIRAARGLSRGDMAAATVLAVPTDRLVRAWLRTSDMVRKQSARLDDLERRAAVLVNLVAVEAARVAEDQTYGQDRP